MTQIQHQLSDWFCLPMNAGSPQTFVIGDIHGQADVLEGVLDQVARTPRSCQDRQLIFLGDVIDRGPKSLKAVELVLNARTAADVDSVVFLPGNHELMLVDGIDSPMEYLPDWLDNGGERVLEEAFPGHSARLLKDLSEMAKEAIGQRFLRAIAASPSYYQQADVIFVHGGLDPSQPADAFLSKPKFGDWCGEHWAWIREPFLDWTDGWRSPTGQGCIVIHGHTPVAQTLLPLSDFIGRADRLESHHRLCLDAGAAAAPQIAWAELRGQNYRIALSAEENFET